MMLLGVERMVTRCQSSGLSAGAFTGGLMSVLDQAGVGGEVLDGGEAADVVDLEWAAPAWSGLQT